MKKYPKSEVGFQHPSREGHRCSGCQHFEVLAPNHCERVQGLILPADYCERFFLPKGGRMAEAVKS